ncbi:PREDICTED: uncharacterized protein LOC107074063 [Polistes dominula]|uniref:Uncharacterized protein LOC107074063 n=1 Tax=Polistes dominula TaxID=743375 RepID=A0ABM1JDN5_POLDO|nr:PREDICTED: uncharacterized protein LOC107074063 [Polistes dominula]
MNCDSMNFSSCYETAITSVMMGWQVLILLIGLCKLRSGLAQSDLQIIVDSIDLQVNEEYFQNCKLDACDNDEMLPIIKFICDFIKEIPSEAMCKCNLYGMVNGEPTEPTGIEIQMTTCQMINDTSFIGPILQVMKIPLECPIQPISIDTGCFTIPMDNFPDFFPSGEYKFAMTLDFNDISLVLMEMYLSFY